MNTPKRLKQRIGLAVALLAAFTLTKSVAPRMFVADSPEINRQFIAELKYIPSDFVAFVKNPFKKQESFDEVMTAQIPKVEHPAGTTYEPIAKGVYASEPDETGKRYIKIDKGTQLEIREVTLDDGRTVKVYVPVE
ncbi:hypothetical protein KBD81_01270 [Candidatus Woesebacteria bacterium]|nr:hypothetical protein [Candidatus Woesebacteria bacterium]